MGIKKLASNTRKKFKSEKTQKWKRQKKAEKKKQQTPKQVNIDDVHLYSDEKLKNKLRNPQNNIKISGKKKRRLTKRLGHALREKSLMDVEVTESKSKKRQNTEDAEMKEDEGGTDTQAGTSAAATTPSSSEGPAGTGKKRTRGRRKNKKKAGDTTAGGSGNMFEENDGWEDVEMTE